VNTIQTRYRDVHWREIDEHHRAYPGVLPNTIAWQELRGKPIQIETPHLPDDNGCGAPWYRIQSGPYPAAIFACSHIAEIGD